MQCQQHANIKDTHKCITCSKFCCSECFKLHRVQNHETITLLELGNIVKTKINDQIDRMNMKVMELTTLKDWQNGCMEQILDYVKKLFQQIKIEYRKISDQCWTQQNTDKIQQIQKKRNILQQWKQILTKKPEQVTYFDVHSDVNIVIDSDEQLIDSSQSYILGNNSPKIVFNQTALRRANQTLSKIIYTNTKNKSPIKNKYKLKSIDSNKNITNSNYNSNHNTNYISLCKFIQNTNIMYQYIVQNHQNQQPSLTLTKTLFKQFITPLKSISITIAHNIYLIGGCNKQNRPRKQIMFYQRTYNTMRIIGLLKQGRIGHAICAVDDNIYVFGGKMVRSLEIFNVKSKTCQNIIQAKYEVMGASMTYLANKLYIFGGTDGIQNFKPVLCYNRTTQEFTQLAVSNIGLYSIPICPILQPINQTQILIIGGYYNFAGNSYNNSFMTIFDTKLKYFSILGKGQLIYPILANGANSVYRQGKVICLADLKRLRHRHGPNLPVLFSYNITDDTMQLDTIGL